ncbi:Indole-3-acetaldehyde oxidase [Linum perenne]
MDQGRRGTGISSKLVFAINGSRFELSDVDPSSTLLEFLRIHTPFKSVKLGCGEGGCGACVVLVSKYNDLLGQVEDLTVSSCLTLLCSLHGCSITTTEGLGNSKDGFHPIHERFAGFHASQCGFCTPGMSMSLYGALVNANKTKGLEPASGPSKLTAVGAEKAIANNLCRCTGYRPIADACKSFAIDVDVEDLGFNSFGKCQDAKMRKMPQYSNEHNICRFPEFLKRETKTNLLLDSDKHRWLTPKGFAELHNMLKSVENNIGCQVKLVVGNTSVGYYKELENCATYIDLRHIPGLSSISWDQVGIEIGAAVTISNAIRALEEGTLELPSKGSMVFKKIAAHMEKTGTKFVQNTGSIGGNLVMAQRQQFPSDIATILLGADAYVNIRTGATYETVRLEEFLERPPLDPKSVLSSVKIPIWELGNSRNAGEESKLLFETYRAAPRPLGNALAYVNAAFLAETSSCVSSGRTVLDNCLLAFGAYGTKHAIRARKVEQLLTGKVLTMNVLHEAINLVKAEVVPEEGTSKPAYRLSVAVGFLFEFLSPLADTTIGISRCTLSANGAEEKCEEGVHVSFPRILSSSRQVFQLNKDYNPVGEPVIKSGAALQASGEAVYVDDIPSPANCLHGAFICSTKPLARVKGIEVDPKSQSNGVSALITYKDIPNGGQNIGSMTIFGPEPLFADEFTRCAGDRIAFVIAGTQKEADVASRLATVNYDLENLEPPILTVEEAVSRSSFFHVPPFVLPEQVGDFSKGMAEADHKILSAEIKLDSQYYFYLESQSALAVPDEDNCMVVYSSSQCPEFAHATIAQCLGVPEHNVRVITRRVGGGFGGKAIKSMPVATACALAAHVLRRPVRIYVNRKTDMMMAGGRHPMKITYSVGYKSTGKITALKLDVLVNAGIYTDVCKTNTVSRSAMRGPGEVQGSYIAEAIIEHVASTLSVDVDCVRKINLHTHDSLKLFHPDGSGEAQEYTLTSLWDKLAMSSRHNQRMEMVTGFNKHNMWKKRGISRVPVIHPVIVRPTPGKVSILRDGSIVVEVGGIELGQGLWTKVKQMTAYALGLIKCVAAEDLLDKVRIIQADTLSLIQGGFTTGSTTSESSCEAVRLCCEILVERLKPLKESLQMEMGPVQWGMLIQQAHMRAVNLSASSYFDPDFSSNRYLTYGAAISEASSVEVNLLTGETTILRSDILYDCGRSLNPAVDLGQIEGAFVQGIGYFMLEEYTMNSDGLITSNGTWTYKIPTIDTIPKEFNVEILSSGHHKHRVLSSKASGEPPLLLASSVHCATRAAIRAAREQLRSWGYHDGLDSCFNLEVPAVMPTVKEHCGLDIVERYLKWKIEQ